MLVYSERVLTCGMEEFYFVKIQKISFSGAKSRSVSRLSPASELLVMSICAAGPTPIRLVPPTVTCKWQVKETASPSLSVAVVAVKRTLCRSAPAQHFQTQWT